ncbi:glycoside hydrolase family 76 protein [Streptomyces sp. NPDC047072]|uniref:glycoside hydrolase family 76 protein n=1 Tax=Streptomyces sp. NPDC047072 TaxID=3154809 RepID=UPI00340CCA25
MSRESADRPNRSPRGRWAATALSACGAVIALLATAVPAHGAPGPGSGHTTARARAASAVEAMMGFYEEDTGRWDSDAPWWQSGNALQALLDYVQRTGDRRYLKAAEHTVALQRAPLPWWPEGGGEFRADSTDDTGWWALAMVRLYDLTHDRRYLRIAELDEAYMRSYGDDLCGGGIYWDIPGATYKNAISNELYLKLAASLHNRIPGDRVYLARARESWEWFRDSGMINGEHLVNDGLTTQNRTCDNNGGPTWTYNQGVLLGGLTELYRATGDRSLLAQARRTADAVVASPALSPAGILTEPCEPDGCGLDGPAFKGVFARNLAELDAVLPGRPYRAYLAAQARSAYAFSRNDRDQYGLSWRGPFDGADIARQESAVSLLTAVL